MTKTHFFRRLLLLCTVALAATGCYHCPVIDCCAFDAIETGEHIDDVVGCVGPAFCVEECEDGTLQYTWITRRRLGPDVHRHRNYIAMVDEDGLITELDWEEEEHHQIHFSSWEPEQADFR